MTNTTTNHPTSAGLRMLADQLDKLAADGLIVPGVTVDIRLERETVSAVLRELDLVSQPVAASRGRYDTFRATGYIGPLYINAWNFLGELCERKVITREFETYVCDGLDLEFKP